MVYLEQMLFKDHFIDCFFHILLRVPKMCGIRCPQSETQNYHFLRIVQEL